METSNQEPTDPQLRKQALLPQMAKLAAEGRKSREIAEEFKVCKSTVNNWLREMRPKPAAQEPPEVKQLPNLQEPPEVKQPLDPAAEIRESIEFVKAMRTDLYDEWKRSKIDKQVRVEEESGPAEEPGAKIKKSVRTETRTGNPAFFKAVMDAQDRIEALVERLAALEGLPARPADRLANLSDDDIENLSDEDLDNFSDDELYAMDLRLRAKREREGEKFERPISTNEEIRIMADEDPAALRQPGPESLDAAKSLPAVDEAKAAAIGDAIPAAVQSAAATDPPPLTAAEQEEVERRKKAERKRYLDRFKDPNVCAYRWDGFRRS